MRLTKYNLIQYLIIIFLIIIAAWHWGQAAKIYGKAYLAKWLISDAWQETVQENKITKPWSWADTWPVAKVVFPNKKSFFILAGGAGNSLAFGPGHLSDTALPGTNGTSVIGGHRDTHFALLQNIKKEEIIQVQNHKGEWHKYIIKQSWIADSKTDPLFIDTEENALYLITCYPFNAITPGGSERFVVKAIAI